MWEIREGETPDREYGYPKNRFYRRTPIMSKQEMESEYDEGYEDGYRCALDDIKKAVHKGMQEYNK